MAFALWLYKHYYLLTFMLSNFKFHHIGVAAKDIDSTATVYEQGGYHRSASIFDPIQNVNICWLTKEGMPTVELLAPVDEKSPVNKTLEKVGVSPYHCCYVIIWRRQQLNFVSKNTSW